jgi:hypothetical protein
MPSHVIVSPPDFFQKDVANHDGLFHFVGPLYNEGSFAKPWKPKFGASGVRFGHNRPMRPVFSVLTPSVSYWYKNMT